MAKTNAERQRDYRKRAAAALRGSKVPPKKNLGRQLVDVVMKLPPKTRDPFIEVIRVMANDAMKIKTLSESFAKLSQDYAKEKRQLHEKIDELGKTVEWQGARLETLRPLLEQWKREVPVKAQNSLVVHSSTES